MRVKLQRTEKIKEVKKLRNKPASEKKGISFADLAPDISDTKNMGRELVGEQGLDQCIHDIFHAVGHYPRSLFLNNINGLAEIRLFIGKSKMTLLPISTNSPLVSAVLCKGLKTRLQKYKGSECFKSIYQRYGDQTLSLSLSLTVGTESNDEFFMIDNNKYLRKITLRSKTSPIRGLILITNVLSAVELIENSSDRLEWLELNKEKNSNSCHRHEVQFI